MSITLNLEKMSFSSIFTKNNSILSKPTPYVIGGCVVLVGCYAAYKYATSQDERPLKLKIINKMSRLNFWLYETATLTADGTAKANWDNIEKMLENTRDDSLMSENFEDKAIDIIDNTTVNNNNNNNDGNETKQQEKTVSLMIRVYKVLNESNNGSKSPCLTWIHDGGFSMGGYYLYHPFLLKLQQLLPNVKIIAISYRKGPKYKFPTAINDIYNIFHHISSENGAKEYGIDRNQIVIGGHSAGAIATAVLAIKLIEDNNKRGVKGINDSSSNINNNNNNNNAFEIRGLYMDAPFGNASTLDKSESYKLYGNGDYLVSSVGVEMGHDAYLNDRSEMKHRYYSPELADDNILKQFGQCLVHVHEWDVVRDSGIQFAQKLQKLGVKCQLKQFDKTTHCTTTMYKAFEQDGILQATEAALWIDKCIQSRPKQ